MAEAIHSGIPPIHQFQADRLLFVRVRVRGSSFGFDHVLHAFSQGKGVTHGSTQIHKEAHEEDGSEGSKTRTAPPS